MTTTPEVPSIFTLMGRVLASVAPVGKDQQNAQQGYRFRGIEGVKTAVSQALKAHGVFYVPEVLARTISERPTKSGTIQYVAEVQVRFTFYGPAGDSIVVGPLWGTGVDVADKSDPKAMTMAEKACLLQVFCIADSEQHDADQQTPEETTARPPVRLASDEQRAKMRAAGKAATERGLTKKGMAAFGQKQGLVGPTAEAIPEADCLAWTAWLTQWKPPEEKATPEQAADPAEQARYAASSLEVGAVVDRYGKLPAELQADADKTLALTGIDIGQDEWTAAQLAAAADLIGVLEDSLANNGTLEV